MPLFEQHVTRLQAFWGVMDEIQKVFVVLDPNPALSK
jgi:hypothetical protein